MITARNTHIPLGEFTSLSGIAYSVIRNRLQGFWPLHHHTLEERNMRLLKKSGLTAFIVFAIAFALVPVFGMRAHAGKTVARVVHQRWGYRSTPYKSFQLLTELL